MSEEAARPGAERPKVRQVEALPVTVEGQHRLALRDPAGFSDRVMIVTPETLFVISCFDGTQTLRDIQAACFRRFQEIVPVDLIRGIARSLDEALLLDSERFHRHRADVEDAFSASRVRPAVHAGAAYEGDASALTETLDRLLAEGAKGAPPLPEGDLVGLIAPHIDLHRGGAGYGAAYHVVARRCRADLFVILGTAHAAPEEPYTATLKAFDTPLGSVETDADFVRALDARCGGRLFENEMVHRTEHSIEFQALLLRHVFHDRSIRIVPILCSSFHAHVERRSDPRADARIADFIGALKETLAGRPDACLVAAADLAHLGPRFGDADPVGTDVAEWCEIHDRKTLGAAAGQDAGGFFAAIAEEKDRRRVCGASAIYTLLEALPPGATGTLLHYGQALDPDRTTFVSFAAMAFLRPPSAPCQGPPTSLS